MTDNAITVVIGLLIPLAGTSLGAALVFLLRDGLGANVQKALLGFASGVMIAASVWSLLIPSIDMAESQGQIPWVPAAVGFLAGVFLLLLLDHVIPHQHLDTDEPEGPASHLRKTTMLVFAVTLHNFPEGMAVGVVFAGMIAGGSDITVASAMALSIGIAIQNIPEGAVISLPLHENGLSKSRSFLYGFLSGVVEPIGAVLVLMLTGLLEPLLPFILAFAAGAMIYVVVEELIPEAQAEPHTNIGTIGCAVGFVLMMVLDVALG